jgi:hypothetical protein
MDDAEETAPEPAPVADPLPAPLGADPEPGVELWLATAEPLLSSWAGTPVAIVVADDASRATTATEETDDASGVSSQ